jgi:hypothetical protein
MIEDKKDIINGIKLTKIANRDSKIINSLEEEERNWIELPNCLNCLEKL